jgi:hypothetical protein
MEIGVNEKEVARFSTVVASLKKSLGKKSLRPNSGLWQPRPAHCL